MARTCQPSEALRRAIDAELRRTWWWWSDAAYRAGIAPPRYPVPMVVP